MKFLFLAIFIISSVIHLYASYQKNIRLRACSKGFIVLALLGWYCCCADPVIAVAVLALVFSWLGDVLLIPHGTKWFVAGGIAFMLSHFFFVLCYVKNIAFSALPLWLAILVAFIYILIVWRVFQALNPHLKKVLFYPMFFYLLINGTMNCFAFYQLVTNPSFATAVTYLGAVLFFCSDTILFFVRFNKNTRFKSHFPVMLTYIIAEFLITYGLITI